MFIVLLNSGESLATKCMSLNNEQCMITPTLIDSKPFMVSLEKCNRSSNAADDLFTKICVLSKTKDVNVKE